MHLNQQKREGINVYFNKIITTENCFNLGLKLALDCHQHWTLMLVNV